MIVIPQNTPEWHAARIGKVTASRIADLTARTKNGYGASRANYMAELIVERLTGLAGESYTSAAMQWGTEKEPDARAAYEFLKDATVEPGGYVSHRSIADAGATPDGFVGEDGLIEIKCPNTATHLETLLGRAVPGKYLSQMQWQMACTGRTWTDFVSFDPRLPASMQFFCARVPRDQVLIDDITGEVVAFLVELNDKVHTLTQTYGSPEIEAPLPVAAQSPQVNILAAG